MIIKSITVILCLFTVMLLSAERFINTYYIDYGAFGKLRSNAPYCLDINRNGLDDMVLFYTDFDTAFIRIYEYTEDSFILRQQIQDSGNFTFYGCGDYDSDGLYELLLFYASEHCIGVMEQSDSIQYPTEFTWKSDTVWQGINFLGSSNKFTNDSVDVIYGNGNPLLSTPTSSKGWYYLTCTGDNQYELLNTYVPDTVGPRAIDVGDFDNDGYCDVMIVMHGNLLDFEAQDTLADSFDIQWRWSTQDNLTSVPDGLIICPDIDQDGKQEIGFFTIYYLSPYHCYHYYLVEDTTDAGDMEIVWEDSILVGYDNMFIFASNMIYGDIDGDSLDELVICGGRTVRAYDVLGNDSIVALWEWTCPTNNMIQSHVTCHDFNKNGYDEIIFAGGGDSYNEYATYIFEDSVAAFVDTTAITEQKITTYEPYISITYENIKYYADRNSEFTLLDILGRPVYREEHSQSGEFDYNTSELMPGIYFIHLKDTRSTITDKFIKFK